MPRSEGAPIDVATLGLRVENGQFVQGVKQADAAVQNLGKTADTSRAKFDAWQKEIAQRAATAQAVENAKRLNAEIERTNMQAGSATMGIGRLRGSITTLAASALSTAPGVAQLGGAVGLLTLGGPVTIGVLAGIAAIAYVYKSLTTESRALRDESDKLTKSLLAQRKAFLDTTEAGAKANVATAALTEATAFKALDNLRRAGNLDPIARRNAEKDLADATTARKQAELNAIQARTDAVKEGWEAENRSYELEKSLAADRKRWADEATAAERRADEAAGKRLQKLVAEYGIRREFAGLDLNPIELGILPAVDNGYIKDVWDAWVKAAQEAYEKRKKLADEAAKADKEYADDMRSIWRQGIGKIITDGTKSFRDFFEDVLQMFSKMMARMEQEGKAKGGLYGALGIGSAAITGAFAGYQIGQQNQGTLGTVGGTAAGALAGFQIAGAWGAVVGGLTGFAGSLLGASKAAKEHAAALDAARKAALDSARSYVTGALGTTQEQETLAAQTAYYNQRADLDKAGLTAAEKAVQLAQLFDALSATYAAIKAKYEEQRRFATEDLEVRYLRATGQDAAASARDLANRQQGEIAAAIAAKMSDEYIARLKEVQAIEKTAAAMEKLTTSFLNVPIGFKYFQSYVYQASEARPFTPGLGGPSTIPYPLPTGGLNPGGGGGDVHFTMMVDGKVLGQAVLKKFRGTAQKKYGDSTKWPDITEVS